MRMRLPATSLALVVALLVGLLAGSVALTAPAQAASGPTNVTVNPVEDSMVVSSMPSTSFGSYDQLSSQSSSDTVQSYLKFNLPQAPAGTTLTSAKLTVRTSADSTAGSNQLFPVMLTSTSWSQSTLSWNNRPTALGAQVGTLAGAGSTDTSYTMAASPDALRGGLGSQVSLVLWGGGSDNLRLFSDDAPHAPYHPALTLTFSPGTAGTAPAPAPPVTNPTPAPAPAPAPATSNGKKVFAHYFPAYPISFDNAPASSDYYTRNYLDLNGENGIWRFCGGLLRDRPQGRAPLSGSDWLLQDMRTEVRQAKAAGIDGFTLNIMGLYGMNWTASLNLMRAAEIEGDFEVIPNIDATASVGNEAPSTIAARLAELYRYSSDSVVGGESLLSSFAAENKSPSWWGQVISSLEQTQHVPIKFIAVFLNASDANMDAFAPISYGFGNWGVRTVSTVTNGPNYAARAHARGKKWMAPVAFQDARPRSYVYAEASNTETGRASWRRAISDQADLVQMVTWNDYSESTQMAPSMAHGSVFLDISRYYISWFTTGVAPAITSDHLYVTHRVHPASAATTSGITGMSPTLGGMNTPARDTVEALVFLTSPAQVALSSGGSGQSFSLPAGVSSVTIPLRAGTVSARIVRGSTATKVVDSPFRVTNTPLVQDFQYWAAGS